MSSDPQAALKAFSPSHAFFVGIDSDGCVFNSMEVKHNDCFSVNVVKHFGLSAVSRQVHEAWDFVNLYSQSRGCNRFKALVDVHGLASGDAEGGGGGGQCSGAARAARSG
ncbi:MAG: hypothetical protein KA712_06680 [Myxococcales bacterium]|nr:hypothetical protein [Myxococcales bacterium]